MTTDLVKEVTIQIPNLTLAAKRWGDEGGALKVLALHGWLHNAASFDFLAPKLDIPGLELVAVDLPGHGLSEHRGKGASYDFVHWLDDVIEVANALGWDRFCLMGHSLGASIAICVAGTIKERVERVVLIDGMGPMSRDPSAAPQMLRHALAERHRLRSNPPLQYGSRQDAIEHMMKADTALNIDAAHALAARALLESDDHTYTWRYDLRLRLPSLLRWTEDQVCTFLGAVTCPVLLIRPDKGWPVDETLFAKRLQRVRHLTVEHVLGNHHVHMTDTDNATDLIRNFLCGSGQEGNGMYVKTQRITP